MPAARGEDIETHVERVRPTVDGANRRMIEEKNVRNDLGTNKIEFDVQGLFNRPPYLGTV